MSSRNDIHEAAMSGFTVFNETHKLIDIQQLWEKCEIDPEYQKNISFQECLVIGKFLPNEDLPTPVGAICLNIIRAANDPEKLVVYLRSTFDNDGRKAGSKISSWLDPRLHTLEEKRTEFVESCKIDKCSEPYVKQTLYMSVHSNDIQLHHTQEGCEVTADDTKTLPFELSQILIGEGANFALMRVLAQNKYIGQFEATTLYINGDLCKNIYSCTGPETGLVNGIKTDICKIYRKIIEKCGIKHICSTTLTTTGQIINHEWFNCDYVVYLNPTADLKPILGNLEPIESFDYFEDLELFSKYLDRKDLTKNHIKKYVKNMPEIHTILSDYVQTVLQKKPADTLKFTMEYFNRFSINK